MRLRNMSILGKKASHLCPLDEFFVRLFFHTRGGLWWGTSEQWPHGSAFRNAIRRHRVERHASQRPGSTWSFGFRGTFHRQLLSICTLLSLALQARSGNQTHKRRSLHSFDFPSTMESSTSANFFATDGSPNARFAFQKTLEAGVIRGPIKVLYANHSRVPIS